MRKIKIGIFVMAILVLTLVPSQAVNASGSTTEDFVYVLSSEETTEVIGSFESAATLNITSSGSKITSASASFFPVDSSNLGSGTLSFSPSIYSFLGSFSSKITMSQNGNSISWSGSDDHIGMKFAFLGDASFSYSDYIFSIVSANSLSLLPASNSDSFSIFLQDYNGGEISFSGSSKKRVVGFVSNPNYNYSRWSFDSSLSPSWASDNPSYYLVGVDSGLEFGPFNFGSIYDLSEVSSWQTEQFYIKSILVSDFTAVASVEPIELSVFPSSINTTPALCSSYETYSLSASASVLSLTVKVSFPANKEVTDYLEDIIHGYDNTEQTSDNQRFEDSRQELQEQEDSLFSSALEGFGDLNMDDYSFGKFSAMAAAFTFVSGFMQSLYVKMGDFGVIVTIGLVVMIASKVIGLYRFSTGGDSS